MPRKEMSTHSAIQHLSILDENGKADEELLPQINEELLLEGYRTMLLARRFDERRLKLQRSGGIGTFAPVNGQEAAQVGTISAIRPDDWFVPSYRETAASIWRGVSLCDMLVFDAGYNEGVSIADAAHDLPNAVPVGTQMLHAAGIGYAARLDGSDEVVMTYFGDGATSQGDFHEAMNFAAVFDSPVIFVCQNNQYAISVPRARQTKSETIAQKALAYGIPGIQVDGNDVFACFVAAEEAVRRAREDKIPTLIECVTYRLEMHTTADDPTRYRDEEEVEKWKARDPISRFGKFLENRDLLDDEKLNAFEEEIGERIDNAWSDAQKRIAELGDTDPIFKYMFHEPYRELEEQRARAADGRNPGVPANG